MKKKFPCGHVGKGQQCRRCLDAKKLEEMAQGQSTSKRISTLMEAARLYSTSSPTKAEYEAVGLNSRQALQLATWHDLGVKIDVACMTYLIHEVA